MIETINEVLDLLHPLVTQRGHVDRRLIRAVALLLKARDEWQEWDPDDAVSIPMWFLDEPAPRSLTLNLHHGERSPRSSFTLGGHLV
jgi:hypothetical protein